MDTFKVYSDLKATTGMLAEVACDDTVAPALRYLLSYVAAEQQGLADEIECFNTLETPPAKLLERRFSYLESRAHDLSQMALDDVSSHVTSFHKELAKTRGFAEGLACLGHISEAEGIEANERANAIYCQLDDRVYHLALEVSSAVMAHGLDRVVGALNKLND